MCGVSTKLCAATQGIPSLPMPTVCMVRREGMKTASPWHPVAPIAFEPSGTTVLVLCGQPEQK